MKAPNIQTDETIDMSRDAPGVPEVIKAKALRLFPSCNKVTIDFETKKKRWNKINGFKLDCKRGQQPDQDIDDVCEMIIRCIAFHYDSLGRGDDDDAGANYRVFFWRMVDEDKVARPSFEYFYDPDATSDSASSDDFVEEDPRDKMLDYVERLCDKAFLRLDEAHQHIIALSNQNSAALKPLTEMTDYMGRAWLAGTAMQTQALGLLFDHKRAEAQVRADTELSKEYLSSIKSFGKEVARQFGRYVNKKIGGSEESESAEADWDGKSAQDEDGGSSSSSASASTSAGGNGAAQTTAPGNPKHPLAAFLGALAESILPRQWSRIADVFTKKERAALTTLLESKTDAEAIEAYELLENTITSPAKLITFRESLNPDQQQAVDQLSDVVEKAREGWQS